MADWLEVWQPQLIDDPPADRLVQLYFLANKWWQPPERGTASDDEDDGDDDGLWVSPLPGVTD